MPDKLFMVSVEVIIEHQYTDKYQSFALSKDDAESDRNEIMSGYRNSDGSFIHGITGVYIDIDEISFDDAKDIMTVDQFESLFHCNVGDLL